VRAYLGLLDGRSPSDQTHMARRRSRATTDYGLNTSNTAPTASLLVIERVQELAVFGVQFADHPSNTEPEPGVAVRVTVDPKGKLPVHWAGATVDHYGGRDGSGTRHRSGAVTHLVIVIVGRTEPVASSVAVAEITPAFGSVARAVMVTEPPPTVVTNPTVLTCAIFTSLETQLT
jgi:hypothetical protein